MLLRIAKRSDGCIRDTQSILGQILALGEKHITEDIAQLVIPRSDTALMVDLFEAFITAQTGKGLEVIQKLGDEGVNIVEFTKEFIEFVRKAMLLKIQAKNTEMGAWTMIDFSEDTEKRIRTMTRDIGAIQLVELIELLITKVQEMKYVDMHHLPLELAIIQYTIREESSSQEAGPGGKGQGVGGRKGQTGKAEDPDGPLP